jgi:predicted glutamine amidotransferase
MSRLFGLVINDPQRVACALHPARESLVVKAAPEGWGLASFQGGEVLLQRHPKPLHAPLDFFRQVRDLRTDYIVGHVADPGRPAKLESTQPFRFRSWVYAQSGGNAEKLTDADAGILEHVPDFLRRNIRAHTASEHLFHVFLAFMHDANKLDDPNVRVPEVAGALRGVVSLAQKLGNGDDKVPALNAMVTNGRILLAVRAGLPMWVRQVSGIVDCKVCTEALPENERRDRRRTNHEHVRAVILVSEPEKVSAEGWEEAPDGSIIGVTRDLSKSFLPLKE